MDFDYTAKKLVACGRTLGRSYQDRVGADDWFKAVENAIAQMRTPF